MHQRFVVGLRELLLHPFVGDRDPLKQRCSVADQRTPGTHARVSSVLIECVFIRFASIVKQCCRDHQRRRRHRQFYLHPDGQFGHFDGMPEISVGIAVMPAQRSSLGKTGWFRTRS